MGSAKGRTPPVTPEQVLHPLLHTSFAKFSSDPHSHLVPPSQSAKGIVGVLQGLTKEDNGSFFNFDGQKLTW
jgi:hypothetical protein